MRTLFWRIFLSFWLVVAAFILIAVFVLRKSPDQSAPAWQAEAADAFAVYAQNLAQAYESGGKPALDRSLQRLAQVSRDQAFLLDSQGNELSGRTPPTNAVELAALARSGGKATFSPESALLAQPVTGASGASYVAIAKFSHTLKGPSGPPPAPPQPLKDLSVAIVLSGIVCFWLARYLSRPIVGLRNAAQELSRGNLAARAGKDVGNRRDEIAELVRDFDLMAGQIEALIGAQKRLISDVSHEFRSPLTRINLAVELIRKVENPEVTTAIARIEQETERLNGMVRHMLTLSRIDSGGGMADKTAIDVAQVLQEVAADANFEAATRNCRVVLHGSEDCTTFGNADLFRSAVENVIRNAIRYTAEQTEVEVRLTCDAAGSGSMASIQIRDHGPGVPESALGELFRPFFRLDESRERSTGGAGLGLAIAQRAVELHGGEISAQNAPGGGLDVTIRFPATISTKPMLPAT